MAGEERPLPIAVVTGANRGIGLALVEQLLGSYRLIACCRHTSPELAQLGVEVVEGVDVADDGAIADFVTHCQETVGRIDLLINNAGVLQADRFGTREARAGLLFHYDINVAGPLLLTKALTPLLRGGSRVAMISSCVGSMEEMSHSGEEPFFFDRLFGYSISKAAMNMATVKLATALRSAGVLVAAIHPGSVQTEMNPGGSISSEVSARGVLRCIEQLTAEESGTFWSYTGEKLPW